MLNKTCITLLILFSSLNVRAQDIINTYTDPLSHNGLVPPIYVAGATYYNSDYNSPISISYTGEYLIYLRDFYWYNNLNWFSGFDLTNYALSYSMEIVSFPFTMEGAFKNGGSADQLSVRKLKMPPLNYDPAFSRWEYPFVNSITNNYLYNKTPLGLFMGAFGNDVVTPTLVTANYVSSGPIHSDRTVLPHTVIKHTINIHCGLNPKTDQIISSVSFLVDNTRGMMRYYPFSSVNKPVGASPRYYDILLRPQMFPSNGTTGQQAAYYNEIDNCDLYNDPIFVNCASGVKGGTINYYPYQEINDNFCTMDPFSNVSSPNEMFATAQLSPTLYFRIPPSPYSLLISTFPRGANGQQIAGYEMNQTTGKLELIDADQKPANLFQHQYTIDNDIPLTDINFGEKTIYNPSDVSITTANLRFPKDYTFKTIRGAYPYKDEVTDDDRPDYGCGGQWPACDPRDVPVTTDLVADAGSGYSTYSNQYLYSSLYRLQSGSKLTIEPCVWLFDCSFEVNPGSEIVLENSPTVLPKRNISKPRYQFLYNGGKVTERDQTWFFQNATENRKILNYEAADHIDAGRDVIIPTTTNGDYVVDAGADVTFAANNYVVLKDGFHAKQGSKFHAYVTPVNVPACTPHSPRIADSNNSNPIVKNFIANLELSLSPNLTSSKSNMNFKIAHAGNYSICILNTLGQVEKTIYRERYYEVNEYSVSIDASDLAPGVYFCQLLGKDEQKTAKFIKVD